MCVGCRKIVIANANRLFGYGFTHHNRCKESVTKVDEEDESKMIIGHCNRRILPCKYTDKKFLKTLTTQVYQVTVPNLENHKSYGDKTYFVDVEGSLINSCEVGQTVDIIGIVKTRGVKPKARLKKFGVYALNLEQQMKLDLTKDLDTNVQHRLMTAWLHDISENNNSELEARNEIVRNLFPHHFGSYTIKLAILLTVCSGCGVSKSDDIREEIEKRDVFHLMLTGRRGSGKRTLLRHATELTPKSNEVMSFGLTINSLTAKAFKLKKRGTSNIEAGVLLRANEGISCFHEFNTLKKKYRQILHEIMETQRIKITTAKLKTHIKLSTSIIAAQRIKRGGRIRRLLKKNEVMPEPPITLKMFKLEESLLNRFDLIFVMNEPKHDKIFKRQIFNMIIDEVTEEICDEDMESDNWPHERITAHIAFAKTYKSIAITNEVHQILLRYYQFCSMNRLIPKWRTTSRMYEGLKRITLAHARLVLRTETKMLDAITTIMLSEMSYPLGFLMENKLQLQDEFTGPSDDYVREVLHKLKLPPEFMQKYQEEQMNTTNISDQIFEMRKQLIQLEVEGESKKCDQVFDLFKKPKIQLPNSSRKVVAVKPKASDIKTKNPIKPPLPSLMNQLKPGLTKKDNVKRAVPKNQPKISKRKINVETLENVEVKKAKVEQPIFNDAIIANLASLSKQFSANTEMKCSTTTAPDNNSSGLDEERSMVQAELKALEDLNIFEDFI